MEHICFYVNLCPCLIFIEFSLGCSEEQRNPLKGTKSLFKQIEKQADNKHVHFIV